MIRIKSLKPTATLRAILGLYFESWAPELSPRTQQRYSHDCIRWEKLSGNPPIAEITTETFQRFRVASAAFGHKPSTTETNLQTVAALLRCAHAHGLIDRRPDKGKSRRIPAPEPNPPTVEELDEFLKHVHVARWPKLHVRPAVFWTSIVAVGCWTGLRRADLIWRLSWEHVDETAIRFRAAKTSALHSFPLRPIVQRHLDAMRPKWSVEPSRPVFGPSASPHLVAREMERISDAAGIRTLTPKMLRQFAVSHWTAAGGEAGALVHGCGLPRVMKHYLDVLAVLEAVADKVTLPAALAS